MTRVLAAEENSNFLVPNATFFVELLLFLIILFIFYRFIVPPLTRAMKEREEMNRKQAQDREEATRQAAGGRGALPGRAGRGPQGGLRDPRRSARRRPADPGRHAGPRPTARSPGSGSRASSSWRSSASRCSVSCGRTSVACRPSWPSRILGLPMGADGPQRDTVDRFLAELDGDRTNDRSPAQRSGGGAS